MLAITPLHHFCYVTNLPLVECVMDPWFHTQFLGCFDAWCILRRMKVHLRTQNIKYLVYKCAVWGTPTLTHKCWYSHTLSRLPSVGNKNNKPWEPRPLRSAAKVLRKCSALLDRETWSHPLITVIVLFISGVRGTPTDWCCGGSQPPNCSLLIV